MRQPSHAHHSMPECQQLCSQDQSSWQRSSSSRRSCWHPNSSRRTRLWAVLICLHTLQAAAIAAAADAAAGAPRPPCVACDDCVTSSCLRVCLPSCKTEPAMAAGSPLTAEQCKHKGQEAAAELATEACKQSQVRVGLKARQCSSKMCRHMPSTQGCASPDGPVTAAAAAVIAGIVSGRLQAACSLCIRRHSISLAVCCARQRRLPKNGLIPNVQFLRCQPVLWVQVLHWAAVQRHLPHQSGGAVPDCHAGTWFWRVKRSSLDR